MKKWFITFGSKKFENALKRIEKEAIDSNFFDEIIIYREEDIPGFLDFHKYFIENNPKGFGHWIWKSYITFKTLNRINEGDILIYLDSGCSINKLGKDRFDEYINLCVSSEYKNISFQYSEYKENQYTKEDVFEYFNVNNEIRESGQLIGGIFILQKCDFITNLVEKYFYTCSKYNLINDKIVKKNCSEFIEHRHDQSVFSCLRKQMGTLIIKQECDLSINGKKEVYENNSEFLRYPFWATRIRI